MDLFVITLALFCAAIYLLNSHFLSYWRRQNIPQIDPTFLLGNLKALMTVSMGEGFANLYERFKKKRFIGFYLSYRPALLVNDPELIQHVMIKDFTSFHDRPMPINEEVDKISGNLFFLTGQKWRDLRVKLTPLFTSGKLKMMFPILRDSGSGLVEHMETRIKQKDNIFEVRDLFARFTTNIISSVAFGVDNDCFSDPDNIFRKIGMQIFDNGFVQRAKFSVAMFLPKLFTSLNIHMTSKNVEDFMENLVKQTIEYREKNNVRRNDFMDLMIQLKNNGYVSVDKGETGEEIKETRTTKLTVDELIAQAFVFFGAGFETSSSTMSLCLFELARNPEVQKKAQKEIDDVLAAHNGEISYDSLNDMKYLECCVDETLRLYPILPMLFRTITKDYQIPDSDVTLAKGTALFIPIMGIQRDPDIFENPMEFRPERFVNSSNGSGNAKGLFYLPFGDGPRNCIGARMGKLQTKLGLVFVLSKFNCELKDNSLLHKSLKFMTGQPTMVPSQSLDLKFEMR